jgi:hypothetical protein
MRPHKGIRGFRRGQSTVVGHRPQEQIEADAIVPEAVIEKIA